MKKIIFVFFSILTFTSCAVFYGTNMEKLAQQLELGMTKQEAIGIMGKDYFVESVSQAPEGKLEVLHFRSSPYYPEYLLYFLNNELVEFHRYIPPTQMHQEIHVIKEDGK